MTLNSAVTSDGGEIGRLADAIEKHISMDLIMELIV